MCKATALAAQAILDALSNRTKNGSVFTAFDVTTDARDGTDENISHTDCREIVHNEFDTGEFPDEYNRQDQLELTNGHVAICYYPDGKVAEDHPLSAGRPSASAPIPSIVSSSQSQQTVAPTTKQGGSVKDGDGYICTETSKRVINIPDVIVKGVTPNGGTYDISITGGKTIYKKADGKGRLRIASSKLGGGGKFRLTIENNTITVTQA